MLHNLVVYCVQQLLITHESQNVYTEIQDILPELRHYAAIDVNEKQCSKLVKILERFTTYVINMYIQPGEVLANISSIDNNNNNNLTCITVYIENTRYSSYVLFCNTTVNSQ